ncbi:MAG TPA: nucleotidyl transferase AbiEii/AbiGii toxin family protein [Ktedonobacterales bacterium]
MTAGVPSSPSAHRPHRATHDLDLLGFGPADLARLVNVFRDLCQLQVPADEDDGLTFQPETVRAAPIREEQEYGSIRVHLLALLGKARLPLQVDVGFGDVVTPTPADIAFPTLLSDLPAPHVRVYPRETVVAEKFEAIVRLGVPNTRMKDFYDPLDARHRQPVRVRG